MKGVRDGRQDDGSAQWQLNGRPYGPRDVACTYDGPLHDAEPVLDRMCFSDERVDVIVDGKQRDRPIAPWSDGQ